MDSVFSKGDSIKIVYKTSNEIREYIDDNNLHSSADSAEAAVDNMSNLQRRFGSVTLTGVISQVERDKHDACRYRIMLDSRFEDDSDEYDLSCWLPACCVRRITGSGQLVDVGGF